MGKGRQWYLGKAAETREPVTERPHGCLSGPGGRRQRGPRGGRRSLSARSTGASSARAPAAPAQPSTSAVWLGNGCVSSTAAVNDLSPCPTLFPAHGVEAKRQQGLLVALPSSVPPSQWSEPWGAFSPLPLTTQAQLGSTDSSGQSGKSPGSPAWVRPVPLSQFPGIQEPQHTGKIWKR